jgi:hypothetical protein
MHANKAIKINIRTQNIKLMTASIYTDMLVEPNDKMLTFDLADAKKYLDKIAEFIDSDYGDFQPEWKFYSKKSGWILKILTKKRNILFVVPCANHFRVAFTFGDKASDLISISKLPDSIKKSLSEAKKYAEGRTIQIEVRTETDSDYVMELIRIKLTN